METRYHNDDLEDWLSGLVSEQAKQMVMDGLSYVCQAKGESVTINDYVNNLLATADDADPSSYKDRLFSNTLNWVYHSINEFGVQLDNITELSQLEQLNKILYTLLEIPSYPDILRVDEILSLGNYPREILSELICLVYPEEQVESYLEIIRDVPPHLLKRIRDVIKSEVDIQKEARDAIEKVDTDEALELLEKTVKHIHLDDNSKSNILKVLRDYVSIVDVTTDVRESIIRTCEVSLSHVYSENARALIDFYALLMANLINYTCKYQDNISYQEIASDVPQLDILKTPVDIHYFYQRFSLYIRGEVDG